MPFVANPADGARALGIKFLLLIVAVSIVIFALYGLTSVSNNLGDAEINQALCPNDLPHCDYLFEVWLHSLNQRVFEWSLKSGVMIFWISVIITFSGLIISFWQFWEASNITRQSEAEEIQVRTEALSVAFKFKSVGAMVLFVSVAYLAIYAEFIYPIEIVEIPLSRPEQLADDRTHLPADIQEAYKAIEVDEIPALGSKGD